MKVALIFLAMLMACRMAPHVAEQENVAKPYSVDITRHGAVSMMAVDLASGEVLLSHRADERMTPASLTKILTTGAALELLGPDYRYNTRFYLQAKSGVNNLYIQGGADPTLGSDRFDESKAEIIFANVLRSLQQRHITSINAILVDNSCLPGISHPSKRLWEDMGNYYGAVPNGLSYKENTFYLTLQSPSGSGKSVSIVETEPELAIELQCIVKSASNNKDSAYIYGHPDMGKWYISGTIPQARDAFVIKGALPHPEMTLGRELKTFLIGNGIEVKSVEKPDKGDLPNGDLLFSHASPELRQMIGVINKKSHNLFADHLLFSMSKGQANWDNGIREVSGFWKEQVPEFSAILFDGSGLSPFNAFSAADMVNVLKWMHAHEHSEVFKHSLSVSGVDGTLKSILKEPGHKGSLIGKSGSMNGVLGYCGYITTQSGKELAFCVMANRFTESFSQIRSNMEVLMKELIERN
ncbi:D-alanyl-D-alanine carboxypeptidase/D-alanyl-D-alanine-endopeptidase [Carboxylicivirga mesophila]|uniref:D-alanyl-D-alanine carboxypeptidase/D-alanyl-D-alanine-endopeptidase n=1 Tax=Carboxylicivirga mesophila TaxID=1166478 RepID=A0ABS5KFH5_9BACT|nr:D-alanyl-D-alanine carboxypeptidase/D-alanyl-D-alanine-endopeptidase [Carboxylicivirga mesophila]MBS2213203.1 D-alanyl-D-alanine carboxypeptidase/D-alanyl-D-alanine-endopeptidase [Carboxylicivirga mesophila]